MSSVTFSRKAGEWIQLGSLLSSIWLPACPVLWSLPPHHPKDRDAPEFAWPGGGCRLQEEGAVDSRRILGGDPEGLGVTMGRRECLPLPLHRVAPPHLRTRTRCFEVGTSPGGGLGGHRVQSKRSPPTSPRVALSGKPITPPTHTHTLARISLLRALPLPLLLFRLPNYQAEVAFWFALFLYVKYPSKPDLFPCSVAVGASVILPLRPPPPPRPRVIGNR